MREVPTSGIEARRWTVVFHRESDHWFFRAIALGHFKHVSAFAWVPELSQWWIYDVGFRRTRLKVVIESADAHAVIAGLARGNALVTIDVREDNLPLMRLGMFCTTAVAHLVGIRSSALRPDRLFRHLMAQGGVLIDDAGQRSPTDPGRPQSRAGAGAGADRSCEGAADPGADRYGGPDDALWHEAGAG